MPIDIGNLSIYMGPEEVGGPDNLKQTIIDFIGGAQKSLDIAVQELDCEPIADAIISARQRGVRVKLVLEASYLTLSKPRANPYEAKGTNEVNRKLHDAILRSAIKVNTDFNPKIFHQKFIVRDGNAVLTGSTNFTETGISKNLNHLVLVHDKKIAKIYASEFREIQQGHFGKHNVGHTRKPNVETVSGVAVKTLFAPDHNPEMEITKQMAKARNQVDFAIFTFSESSAIDDQMLLLAKAGVEVRGSLDGKQANQTWAATKHLIGKDKIEIRKVPQKKPLGKLHHKIMVIDKQVVIAGSFNYTGPANLLNDENILILGEHGTTDPVAMAAQKQLAGYVLKEIDRIYDEFGVDI